MRPGIYILAVLLLAGHFSWGQSESGTILQGNRLYKQKDFPSSEEAYKKALSKVPDQPVASYNLGNAQFRSNKFSEAVNSFDNTIRKSEDLPTKEKAYYNKGVAFSKEKKLQESIDSWKNALKLDPSDKEARENLQKALIEQKKQQQQQKQEKENKKKDKQDKQDKQDKKNQYKEPQKPKNQQSKLTKKQVEQLLKALAQKEKEVQQKLQSKNSSPSQQDKDW